MDKLRELAAESKRDLDIDDTFENLHQESYKNQRIRPKWSEYKAKYKLLIFQLKADHRRLYLNKWEYYAGKADPKTYSEKPFDMKVLKTDLDMYINADEEIIESEKKIEYYKTILGLIEDTLKSIEQRGWDIKNAQQQQIHLAGGF